MIAIARVGMVLAVAVGPVLVAGPASGQEAAEEAVEVAMIAFDHLEDALPNVVWTVSNDRASSSRAVGDVVAAGTVSRVRMAQDPNSNLPVAPRIECPRYSVGACLPDGIDGTVTFHRFVSGATERAIDLSVRYRDEEDDAYVHQKIYRLEMVRAGPGSTWEVASFGIVVDF